ncbi:MAG TPA: MerR family transcriptional regulator [Microbacterium sp.]|nr:MerR family transcriptional regulator [Microbacterium sp.]
MLSIGAFAQIGHVTHRMLRHWDQAGLLVPAHTDPATGYRSYDPAQLERLHRIVALRQLGFGLADIGAYLEAGVDAERLASLLRIRRAEVAREQRVAAERLADVERRLHLIEEEHTMSTTEIIDKALPAVRLAASSGRPENGDIAALVSALFARAEEAIGDVEGAFDAPIAVYDFRDGGMHITAGYAWSGPAPDGLEIVELPAVAEAVCGIHLGSMDGIGASWQAVHVAIAARGMAPDGPCREHYVRSWPLEDQSEWVTELQQPVTRPA